MGSSSLYVDPQNYPGIGTGNIWKWDCPIGFANLDGMSILPGTQSDIQYVVCYIGDDIPSINYSESRYFYVDRTCSIYDTKQIMFKNKLGAWEYFTFTQDNKKSQTYTRNIYKKNLNWGDVKNSQNRSFRGNKIISLKIEEEYTVNSNWITEIEYEWLSELISSQDVYVKEFVPTSDDFYYLPIIITDTRYEFKSAFDEQIFNLTINYKLANDKPAQMI